MYYYDKWEFLSPFHFFMFKWKRPRKPLTSISELFFLSVKGQNSIPITRGSAEQSVSQILGWCRLMQISQSPSGDTRIYAGPVSAKSLDTLEENGLYKSQILSGCGTNTRMWAKTSTPILMIWLKQYCCSMAFINVLPVVSGEEMVSSAITRGCIF